MPVKVVEPPTIRELLQDPVMKKVLLTSPRLPHSIVCPDPWRVWGIRHDGKWAGKTFGDYHAGFDLVKQMIKDVDTYRDAVIYCRSLGWRPPPGLELPRRTHWCGYCRRPSVFRRMANHPVMRKWPVIDPEVHVRCYYCANKGPQRVWYW